MASFGERLRHERELRGVSLREIADGTKISLRFLQALEEDRMDVLPGGLFPRAFVRQYASFLGLNAAELAADFTAAHSELQGEILPPASSPRRFKVTPGQLVLAGIVLLVVGLSLRRPQATAEKHRAQASAAPVAAAPAVLASDRVYLAPQPAVASAPDGLVLTMTAQQDCWVEVRADGATVINRVLAEGESQRLTARGEIVLSVGNAGGLSIRLNDQPALPLGRSGEVRKNIVITRQNLPALVDETRSTADGRSG